MIAFARTTDLAAIHAILTDIRCWRRMVNDAAPPREEFQITPSDIEYVTATEDGITVALFLLVPPIPECHVCVLPQCWGRSREITRAWLDWVWGNTPYRRLVGPVPAYNRTCLKLSKNVGFTQFGVEHDAVQKHGKVYDRLLMEIVHPSPGSNARFSR